MTKSIALKLASLSFGGGGGTGVQSGMILFAKVKNVDYFKDVQLHYRRRDTLVWNDMPLRWQANHGNYDLFVLEPPVNLLGAIAVEFALRYVSDGETYWDNNGGANYSLDPTNSSVTSGGNVMLSEAASVFGGTAGSSYVTGVSGEIFVPNLCYHKRVGIRHSSDGWTTYSDITGRYNKPLGNGGRGDLESWRFGVNTSPTAFPGGRFAVFFQNIETGQYYWDNNFGQDYDLRAAGNLQ